SKETWLPPQTSVPGCTRPPSRNRLPGAICCSAAIVGVEKKTIESLSAYSTSPAAKPSTASALPIKVRRRCLRVIGLLSSYIITLMVRRRERAVSNHEAPVVASSFETLAAQAPQDEGIESLVMLQDSSVEPEIFEAFIQLLEPLGIAADRRPRISLSGGRLVALAHHEIGAHQAQPAVDIVAVLLQPRGEALDHAADHGVAIAGVHILGRRHGLVGKRGRRGCADPDQGVLQQRTPGRVSRRFLQHG